MALAWKHNTMNMNLEDEDDKKEKGKTGLLLPSVEFVEQEQAYLASKLSAKLAARRQEVKLDGDIISQEVLREHATDIITSSTLAQSSIESLKRLIQKLNRIAQHEENPSYQIPVFKDEPEEFRKIRQQHHCISLLMSEFDTISDALMYGREKEVALVHEKSLKASLADQRKKLIIEYDKVYCIDRENQSRSMQPKDCIADQGECSHQRGKH